MWMRKSVGIALLGFLMVSCTDGVLVHSEVLHTSDVRNHLVFAVTEGAVNTRFQNNPYPSSKNVLNLTVGRAVGGRNQEDLTAYAYETTSEERGLYSLIIRFEPPNSLSGAELCEGNDGPAADSVAGKIRVLAVFCLGESALSEAKGEVGNVNNVDNPALERLIRQVLFALFPPDERDMSESN